MLAAHVGFYVRDSGTTQTWKKLTCEVGLQVDFNSNTSTDLTKCGPFTAVTLPAGVTIVGDGVCNFNPASNEFSHDQLQNDLNNGQLKDFRIQNEAFGSTGLSDLVMINGSGYFTKTQMTAKNGENVKFTYEFASSGTVILAES